MKFFKKSLSIALTLALMLTSFCVFPEFMPGSEAEAAAAGTYDVRIWRKVNSRPHGCEEAFLNLDCKANNGTGAVTTHQAVYDRGLVNAGEGTETYYYLKNVGFPTHMYLRYTADKYEHVSFDLRFEVSPAGQNSWKNIGGGHFNHDGNKHHSRDFNYDIPGENYPAASAVRISAAPTDLTLPKSGSVSSTVRANVYDQYGVQMTYDPSISMVSVPQGAAFTGSGDQRTFTADSSVRRFVAGSNAGTASTLTVKASYGSFNEQTNITLHNPADIVVRHVDYDGRELQKKTVSYGTTVTAPAHPVRDYDSTYHYSPDGWTNGDGNVYAEADITVTAKFNIIPHNMGNWETKIAPTCTADGVKIRRCVCGYSETASVNATGHSWDAGVITKAATCTETGIKTFTCTVCGDTYTEILAIDPTNHAEGTEIRNIKNATCTEKGYTGDEYCIGCGAMVKEGTETPVLGHSMSKWYYSDEDSHMRKCTRPGCTYKETAPHKEAASVTENEKPATCTKEGSHDEVIYCADCGFELSRKTVTEPPTGHNFVLKETVAPTCIKGGYDLYVCTNNPGHTEIRNRTKATEIHTPEVVPGKKATCTESGLTEGLICSVCGSVLVPQKVILADGHNLIKDRAVPATCTHTGLTEGWHCEDCDYVIPQEVIPMKEHSFEVYPGIAPTCTEPGRTEGLICKGCGKIINSAPVEALGHNYTAEVHEATCTEQGYIVYTCANDPTHTYTEITSPALGHTGGKATCLSPAVCSRCGKLYGTKGEHSYIPTVIAPTCTKGGYTEFTCEFCGKTYTDNRTEKAEHVYDDGVITVVPTCTKDGEKTYTCVNCGKTYTETVKAQGHRVENWEAVDGKAVGRCTVCGEEQVKTLEEAGIEIPVCERCGMKHVYKYGIFKYKGIWCSLVYFFRQISEMFRGF